MLMVDCCVDDGSKFLVSSLCTQDHHDDDDNLTNVLQHERTNVTVTEIGADFEGAPEQVSFPSKRLFHFTETFGKDFPTSSDFRSLIRSMHFSIFRLLRFK